MFESDLGNKLFTRWLLNCDQRKRKRLVSKVQKQLVQMGVSGESMKRALHQISQRTEVNLRKFTKAEIKMHTQWRDVNCEGGYRSRSEWCHVTGDSWSCYKEGSFFGDNGHKSWYKESPHDSLISQRYLEPLAREGKRGSYSQDESQWTLSSRRYSERENYYDQPNRYSTRSGYHYCSRRSERRAAPHMSKDFYTRKRKTYSSYHDNGKREKILDKKRRKLFDDEKKYSTSVRSSRNSFVCKNLKRSVKEVSETEKEQVSDVSDDVCSDKIINVTGSACNRKVSNVGEQLCISIAKGTGQTLSGKIVPHGSGNKDKIEKDGSKEIGPGILIVMSEKVGDNESEQVKVGDNESEQVRHERATMNNTQFTSKGEERETTRNTISCGIDKDGHCLPQREISSVVNTVITEVDQQENTIKRKEHSPIISEVAPLQDSRSLVIQRSVSAVQEMKGTSASKKLHVDLERTGNFSDSDKTTLKENKSCVVPLGKGSEAALSKLHGDLERMGNFSDSDKTTLKENKSCAVPLGKGSEVRQKRTNKTFTGIEQGTKSSALIEETECFSNRKDRKSKHEFQKSHTLSKEGNINNKELENVESRAVVRQKPGQHKEDASVQNYTGSRGAIGNDKAKVLTEVGETATGQLLGESKHVEKSWISGELRKVALHGSSLHEGFDKGSQPKPQQLSQQNIVPRVISEQKTHKDSKWQLLSSELREISHVDDIKNKTSNGCFSSINKDKNSVTESASVEKTLKEDGKLSNHLVSKEKSEMDQTIPCNNSIVRGKQNVKTVPKYPAVVRKTAAQYYTTIDEYFGRNFTKTKEETEHDDMDTVKNLVEKELASENRFPEICKNLEKCNQAIKTKNSTISVSLSAELKLKLGEMPASQCTSKSFKSVKRRSSEPKYILSKIHKKRRYSYGGEETVLFGESVERHSRMGSGGNELIKSRKKEEKMLDKESSHCSKTEAPVEKVIKIKPEENGLLKTRKSEDNILEMESPHFSKTEQTGAQGVSVEKSTKMRPGGNEMAKSRKTEDGILEEKSLHCSKAEQRTAAVHEFPLKRATQSKSGVNGMVKISKNEGKILEKESLHCSKTKRQTAAHGLSIEKGTTMKPGGKKMTKIEKNKLLRKEGGRHSLESLNGCEKKQKESKKLRRRHTMEDVTCKNAMNTSKLDLKISRHKKRSEMMLKLFGEDPEEPLRKESKSSEEVGIKEMVTITSALGLGTKENDNERRNCKPGTVSHGNESETKSLIKGIVSDSYQQKAKGFRGHQTSSTSHKTNTLGENHQKYMEPGGEYETEISVPCSIEDRNDTDAVAQNNRLKQYELGHQQSSSIFHEKDRCFTGSIKEGENGDYHLIINMGNVDTFFPSPQNNQSGATIKLLSPDYNVAKDVNDVLNGGTTKVSEKSIAYTEENPNVSTSSATESVAEKRVASVKENINESISDTVEKVPTLSREVTGSADKHTLPLPCNKVCDQQNLTVNQYHTIQVLSRSELPLESGLEGEGDARDSLPQSQNLNSSVTYTKQTKVTPGVAEIHSENILSQNLCDKGFEEIEVKKEKLTDSAGSEDIQKKDRTDGEKNLTKCNSVLEVEYNRVSCSFQQSTEESNQSQPTDTSQENTSQSGENPPSLNVSISSVMSDQQPTQQSGHSLTTSSSLSELLPLNSRSTNENISCEGDVSTFPRIRVRDPQSLGIPQSCSLNDSFFETMDRRLNELTEVTYLILLDIISFGKRKRALSRLTGAWRNTETTLAMAEFASPRQVNKAKQFIGLFKDFEMKFKGQTEGFLLKRLDTFDPSTKHTSDQLKTCQKYCLWIQSHSHKNQENEVSTSDQVTTSSVLFPQQLSQQKSQQSIGVPIALNSDNLISSLSHASTQAGGQIPQSSEVNINCIQQTSENITSVTQPQDTSSRKEMTTHTTGFVTKPPSYNLHTKQVLTKRLNARHAQIGNIPQQQLPNYHTPRQTENSSIHQSHVYANSNHYIPPGMPATDRTVPPPEGQHFRKQVQNGGIPNIISHNYMVNNTAPNVPANNNNVVTGYTGPVSGPSYSRPTSLYHSYSSNQQGALRYNLSNTLYPPNKTVQHGALSHHLSNDTIANTTAPDSSRALYQAPQQGTLSHNSSNANISNTTAPNSSRVLYSSNQATQQRVFMHMRNNAIPNKSVPYVQNEAIRQSTFSQHASNSLPNMSIPNTSSNLYPRNELVQQHPRNELVQQHPLSNRISNTLPDMSTTNCTSLLHPSNIMHNTFSHYMNNVALTNITPRSYGRPHLPKQAINQGILSHQFSNDIPSNATTQTTQRSLLLQEMFNSAPTAVSTQLDYQHHGRNNSFPPPPLAPLSNFMQPTPQFQQLANMSGHHASVGQGNTGSYNKRGNDQSGPPTTSNSLSDRRNNQSGPPVLLANSTGSHSLTNIGNNQIRRPPPVSNSSASKNISNRINNRSGPPTTSNSLSDRGNNQSRPPILQASSTASNRLINTGNNQIGRPPPVGNNSTSNSLSDGRNHHSGSATTSNSLSDRGNNQSRPQILQASCTGSNSITNTGNNQIGRPPPVANSSADNNSLSFRRNDRSGPPVLYASSAASNNLLNMGNNMMGRPPPVTSSTANNSLSNMGNNQIGRPPPVANSSASHSPSDRRNNEIRPPPVVDIPGSFQLQAGLNGEYQQSNRSTQKSSISEVGQRDMSTIILNPSSGAASYPSTVIHTVSGRVGLSGLYTVSQASPLEDPQLSTSSISQFVSQPNPIGEKQSRTNSKATKSPTSLQNSQCVSHTDQHSNLNSSQQEQSSNTLPRDQPVVSKNIPLATIEVSGSQNRVPACSRQAARMPPAGHTPRNLRWHVYEPVSTYKRPQSMTVSEPPIKTFPDQESTHDAGKIGNQQNTDDRIKLQICGSSSNRNLTHQPGRVEFVDTGNVTQIEIGTEVGGTQGIQKVVNTNEKQDKSNISDRMHELSKDHPSPGQKIGLTSVLAGEAENSEAVEVPSETTDQSEITNVDVMSTSESFPITSSLDKSETDVAKEVRESDKNGEWDSDIEVLDEVLPQPRTVSRDSGYTTPSPMVANVNIREDQKEETVIDKQEPVIQCAICEKAAESRCSGCRTTCYCSEECQLEDWNTTHHTICCAAVDD